MVERSDRRAELETPAGACSRTNLNIVHPHRRRRGEDRRFRQLGITYPVKTTDTVVVFDSSLTTQAPQVADLAAGTYIGEEHSFIWYGSGDMNTPPLIQGGAGVLMMRYAGMAAEGSAVSGTDNHHDARRLHHVQVDGRLLGAAG